MQLEGLRGEIIDKLDDFREQSSSSFQAGHLSCLNIHREMMVPIEDGFAHI